MSDDKPAKVVAFKVISNTPEATITTVSAAPAAELTVMEHCVGELNTFLMENVGNVRYFVAGVALDSDPDNPNSTVAFHMFTSPLSMPDLAMTISMFQNTLFAKLNSGDY